MNNPGVTRIDHIVIDTANLEDSLKFYSQLPGVATSVEKGRGVARIGIQKINIHIYPPALSPVAAHPVVGMQEFSLAYAGDEANFQRYLQAKGIEIFRGNSGCELAATGVCNDFYIHDPDKNIIRIQFSNKASGDVLTGVKGLYLYAGDMDAMSRFYGHTLGMEIGGNGNDRICKLADGYLRLKARSGHLVSGACDFCLITKLNIRTVFENLAGAPFVPNLGITQRSGAMGPIRSVYLRDPAGNLVEIASYAG